MEATTEVDIKGSYRDSVATISKEGTRNFINPKKPKGRLYNLRTRFSIFYLIVFFTSSIYKGQWRATPNVKCAGPQVYHFWNGILAPGLFYFRYCHAHIRGVYYFIYGSVWSSILRMGMPANYFYGNGFS